MTNLKDATREHFDEISLSQDQLESLNALMANNEAIATESHKKRSKKGQRWWIKSAAIVAAIFFIGLGTTLFSSLKSNKSSQIAEEVTYNHQKLKPLEITSNQISEVANYFSAHKIRVVRDSGVLDKFEWELQGGRFCSIQGTDAAQLRYKTKTNEVVSVYMAPYTPHTMGIVPQVERGEEPLNVVLQGNEVWIWVEQNQIIATTVPYQNKP